MKKEELISQIGRSLGASEKETTLAFDIFLQKVSGSLNSGEALRVPGLGIFQLAKDPSGDKSFALNFFSNESIKRNRTRDVITFPVSKKISADNVDEDAFSLSVDKPLIPLAGKHKQDFLVQSTYLMAQKEFEEKAEEIVERSVRIDGFDVNEMSNVHSPKSIVELGQGTEDGGTPESGQGRESGDWRRGTRDGGTPESGHGQESEDADEQFSDDFSFAESGPDVMELDVSDVSWDFGSEDTEEEVSTENFQLNNFSAGDLSNDDFDLDTFSADNLPNDDLSNALGSDDLKSDAFSAGDLSSDKFSLPDNFQEEDLSEAGDLLLPNDEIGDILSPDNEVGDLLLPDDEEEIPDQFEQVSGNDLDEKLDLLVNMEAINPDNLQLDNFGIDDDMFENISEPAAGNSNENIDFSKLLEEESNNLESGFAEPSADEAQLEEAVMEEQPEEELTEEDNAMDAEPVQPAGFIDSSDDDEEEKPRKAKGSALLWLVLSSILVVTAAGAYYFLYMKKPADKAIAASENVSASSSEVQPQIIERNDEVPVTAMAKAEESKVQSPESKVDEGQNQEGRLTGDEGRGTRDEKQAAGDKGKQSEVQSPKSKVDEQSGGGQGKKSDGQSSKSEGKAGVGQKGTQGNSAQQNMNQQQNKTQENKTQQKPVQQNIAQQSKVQQNAAQDNKSQAGGADKKQAANANLVNKDIPKKSKVVPWENNIPKGNPAEKKAADSKPAERKPAVNTASTSTNISGLLRNDTKDKMVRPYIFSDGNRFTIQKSSWQSSAKAAAEVNKYRRMGFDSYIVVYKPRNETPWYRVRIGDFSSSAEAEETLKKLP
ncbi:MAG: SPOR domain-containing protein [Bacillota bacterium]